MYAYAYSVHCTRNDASTMSLCCKRFYLRSVYTVHCTDQQRRRYKHWMAEWIHFASCCLFYAVKAYVKTTSCVLALFDNSLFSPSQSRWVPFVPFRHRHTFPAFLRRPPLPLLSLSLFFCSPSSFPSLYLSISIHITHQQKHHPLLHRT